MKIIINPALGDPFVLADHGDTSPSNLRIDGQTMADVAEYLRADTVDVFDRGNRRTTIQFTVHRLHADFEAAELYILEHETELPRRGVVEFEAHGAMQSMWLPDAVLTSADSQHTGVTTIHSYTIIGGALTNVEPV